MPALGRGAGEYNDHAVIQKNNPITKEDGQLKENWQPFGTKEWVQMVPRGGGRERRIWEQIRSECSHIVRGRYASQLKDVKASGFRFVFEDEGITLNIVSRINVDGRNIEFQYECIEVQQ